MTEFASKKELKIIRSELELIREELQQLNQNIFQILQFNQEKSFSIVNKNSSPKKLIKHPDLKSYMETLKVIKNYEKTEKKGITAQILAKMRNLSRPTIYYHLEELHKSNLIISRRGSLIGLKPANANFYHASEREPARTLWNYNILSSLPASTQKIAQTIMKAKQGGVTIPEIQQLLSLSINTIEQEIQRLLKEFLIDFYIEGENHKYFAIDNITKLTTKENEFYNGIAHP